MRVLIVSDIHGNLPALESVLGDAGSFDLLWNLGDTAGYGPWPNECIDLVRSYPDSIHLAGNHDLAAVGAISTDGFNAIAADAAHWTLRTLSEEHREWLANLPSIHTDDHVTLAHGSPRAPAFEYIITSRLASENFAHFSTPLCFVGHTHVPMIVVEGVSPAVERPFKPEQRQSFALAGVRAIINPGSVGQPRDGDPRAAYAILRLDIQTVEFRRVPYPISSTRQSIIDAGLPKALGDRLLLGR
jgi:diadenosine tetraphosphatase ApaH/serine/threonine PP2A family protein phosphatase